ncbi:hypothetical protein VNI00_010156 [Paramarasmius palmivorus]|uniref:Uncharacterized protein n=1 Tax=Paramarasmius palmivorus TaxID=297713 RepID=A0AAW0CIZ6_9AGAR
MGLADFFPVEGQSFAEIALVFTGLSISSQLVGIYPSALIVVVYLQKSIWDLQGIPYTDEGLDIGDGEPR